MPKTAYRPIWYFHTLIFTSRRYKTQAIDPNSRILSSKTNNCTNYKKSCFFFAGILFSPPPYGALPGPYPHSRARWIPVLFVLAHPDPAPSHELLYYSTTLGNSRTFNKYFVRMFGPAYLRKIHKIPCFSVPTVPVDFCFLA